MTDQGVDERVNRRARLLGCGIGDRQSPCDGWMQGNRAKVGEAVGHAGGQDGRCQSVADDPGGDRIVGDFVGAYRMDAGGGEAGVEALS